MNQVETSLLKGELLPIIKPLIIQILEEEILSKGSNSLLTNNSAGIATLPVGYQSTADANRSKELELLERIIRLEEHSNYIREDIKKVHIDMKELRRQDCMDKRFLEVRQDMKELRQDMDKQFIAVRQEMKELRQDMDKRLDKQTYIMMTGIAFITILITIFKFIK